MASPKSDVPIVPSHRVARCDARGPLATPAPLRFGDAFAVTAFRQEGSTFDPSAASDASAGSLRAWPSRRIAEVTRRFDTLQQTGTITTVPSAPAASETVRVSCGGRCARARGAT